MDDTPTLQWNDARTACQENGVDLAIIKSAEEENFIWNSLILKQNTVTEYGAWLGLHRKADSKFYWVDNTPLLPGYSDWKLGQPDHFLGVENCVHIVGGKWNDLRCDSHNDAYRAPVILCQRSIQSGFLSSSTVQFTIKST